MKEAFKARENLRSSFAGFFQLCPLPPTADHPVLVMRYETISRVSIVSVRDTNRIGELLKSVLYYTDKCFFQEQC
jgi:hypothetical protein